MQHQYDAIIVGGGPGGATTALYAERLGLNVLLLDKKQFPRDKICGDAISGKSILFLRELGLIEQLERSPQAFVDSILFSSPNNTHVKIKLVASAQNVSQGFVCRREVYDNILFQAAKEKVETREGFSVKDVLIENGQVYGVTGEDSDGKTHEITAKVVVGADGYNSILLRKLGMYDNDPEHMLVATRAYYTGVKGMTNAIELHYVESVNPGYFWIFPLENGMANVGIGMVIGELKRRNVKLRQAHLDAVNSPEFRDRFANAELIGDIVGWNLPAGSKRRKVHSDGVIFIGDAAGLIDPFTGEGIGNAMASAKIAAECISELVNSNASFDANSLNIYEERLWKRLGNELSTAYKLQRTARFKALVNLVVKKASKNPKVSDWISGMIAGNISRRELLSPMTYLKLIFN